jgi:hypothetical protein
MLVVLLVAGGLGQSDAGLNGGGNEPGAGDRSLAPAQAEPEKNRVVDAPATQGRGYAVDFRIGLGRLWGRADDVYQIRNERVDGTSIPLEFAAGLHLTDDLILFGAVSDVHAFTSAYLSSRVDLYGLGLGLKYYGTPTGFFVRASVSRTWFRYRNDDWEPTNWPEPYSGITGSFSMGKEWRTGAKWRLGLSGEIVLGRSRPENWHSFTHVAAALVASIGYDSDGGPRSGSSTSSSAPAASDKGVTPLALYLDARLGVGVLWASSGDFVVSGATVPLGVAAGMSLTSDLVAFAEASYISMRDPHTDDSFGHIFDFHLYGAGLGLKYYLTPRRFFLSGSVSVARLRYESADIYNSDGSTSGLSRWGVWGRLAVGQEWPVSPNFSVGVAGELEIGRMAQAEDAYPREWGSDAYVPKGLSLVLLGSYGSPAERDDSEAARVAQAPIPPTMGLFLSLGLGIGTVSGRLDSRNFDSSETLDRLSKAFPFTMGVGYRFSPRWSSDVSLSYAPLSFVTSSYDSDSARDFHLGAALRWHSLSRGTLHPWVSLGLGVEWLSVHSNDYTDAEAKGYDLALQIGSDVRVGRLWTLGPYASVLAGMYTHLSLDSHCRGCSPSEADLSSSDRALHEWFTIGVRGTFASNL